MVKKYEHEMHRMAVNVVAIYEVISHVNSTFLR